MKSTTSAWLAVVMSAMLFAGCTSTGTIDGEGAAIEDRSSTAGGAVTSGAARGGTWAGSELENPNSLLYTKTIYFDFDESTIRSDFVDVLRAHAGYLITNPSAAVLLEGHADERGSREYNIALGERRANAVRQFLEAEGVSSAQINTISYGEERPAELGHDDMAWSANRRAVLVY
jgi:peptidoglycan-associated lipoprotein